MKTSDIKGLDWEDLYEIEMSLRDRVTFCAESVRCFEDSTAALSKLGEQGLALARENLARCEKLLSVVQLVRAEVGA